MRLRLSEVGQCRARPQWGANATNVNSPVPKCELIETEHDKPRIHDTACNAMCSPSTVLWQYILVHGN